MLGDVIVVLQNHEARFRVLAVMSTVREGERQVIEQAIRNHREAGVTHGHPPAAMCFGQRTLRIANDPDEVHHLTVGRKQATKHGRAAGVLKSGQPKVGAEVPRKLSRQQAPLHSVDGCRRSRWRHHSCCRRAWPCSTPRLVVRRASPHLASCASGAHEPAGHAGHPAQRAPDECRNHAMSCGCCCA